ISDIDNIFEEIENVNGTYYYEDYLFCFFDYANNHFIMQFDISNVNRLPVAYFIIHLAYIVTRTSEISSHDVKKNEFLLYQHVYNGIEKTVGMIYPLGLLKTQRIVVKKHF
ncbi:hypothetical protein ALC53_02795, partial [Atta colombica]